jgi:hypothetical protein
MLPGYLSMCMNFHMHKTWRKIDFSHQAGEHGLPMPQPAGTLLLRQVWERFDVRRRKRPRT